MTIFFKTIKAIQKYTTHYQYIGTIHVGNVSQCYCKIKYKNEYMIARIDIFKNDINITLYTEGDEQLCNEFEDIIKNDIGEYTKST